MNRKSIADTATTFGLWMAISICNVDVDFMVATSRSSAFRPGSLHLPQFSSSVWWCERFQSKWDSIDNVYPKIRNSTETCQWHISVRERVSEMKRQENVTWKIIINFPSNCNRCFIVSHDSPKKANADDIERGRNPLVILVNTVSFNDKYNAHRIRYNTPRMRSEYKLLICLQNVDLIFLHPPLFYQRISINKFVYIGAERLCAISYRERCPFPAFAVASVCRITALGWTHFGARMMAWDEF